LVYTGADFHLSGTRADNHPLDVRVTRERAAVQGADPASPNNPTLIYASPQTSGPTPLRHPYCCTHFSGRTGIMPPSKIQAASKNQAIMNIHGKCFVT
jgi:hypothetical protein